MRTTPATILCAILVLLASMGCLGALNQVMFDKFLADTYDENLLTKAESLRNIFAQAFVLGLQLRDLQGAADAFDIATGAESGVSYAAVYERSGAQFRSFHGAPAAGSALPAAQQLAMRREPAARYWSVQGRDGRGVLVPIVNSFGATEGLIVMLASADRLRADSRQFARVIWIIQAGTALPLALLLVPLTLRAIRPLASRLPAWSRFARDFAAAQRSGAALPAPPPPRADDALAQIIAQPYAALAAAARSGTA